MIDDLRSFLDALEGRGQLQRVLGADPYLEIGTFSELWEKKAPALLFDQIKGFPQGYRVLTNALNSPERICVAMGLHPIADRVQLAQLWREKLTALTPIPPETVASGPVFEHVDMDQDVNVLRFPSPWFHELDGGYFIGTGSIVITQDPDSGWINLGTYRSMVHDRGAVGVGISPGKHGLQHLHKYWDQGRPAPVAISVGHDPLLLMCAGMEVPFDVSEYAFAGAIRGHPYEVVQGPKTGLPIPARAEIVIEGEIFPNDLKEEGPFGEWAGYYADYYGPRRMRPVVRIRSICYRNDPIIFAAAPGPPPSDATYFLSPIKSAGIWNEMERAGVPGIKGVWEHECGGGRLLVVVSIRALYPGHSKQAAFIAGNCHQGGYGNRFVIVVDDDIEPSNLEQVMWALCTRVDLQTDINVVERCWTSPSDPMVRPIGEVEHPFSSRAFIDATRPFERRDTFPPTVQSKESVKRAVLEKWPDLFGKGTNA